MGKTFFGRLFMQKNAKSERPLGLVFAALGNTDWGALEIEIIAGREESLLLARPASGVYISREALSRLASHGR